MQEIGMSSPFDALMQVREDGTEFWSARDLMEPLGYDTWRMFERSVHRAFESAKAHGEDPKYHFVGADKMVEIGSGARRYVKDVYLTRRAAYLVAMNGDPLKDEIKEAQHYFVTKTREAEVNPVQPVFDPNSVTRLDMARMLLEAETERLALEARVTELEPKADEWDKWQDADSAYSVGDAAQIIYKRGYRFTSGSNGRNNLFSLLLDKPKSEGGMGWFRPRSSIREPRRPYQSVVNAGYVIMRPGVHYQNSKLIADATPLITTRGIDAIIRFLRE